MGMSESTECNQGKLGRFQTRKPGSESGQKPGFTGLILGVNH